MSSMKFQKQRIAFSFLDTTYKGHFKSQTSWGFELENKLDDAKSPRWGKVLGIGEDVTNVEVGDYIFIEQMMWSLNINHDNARFWVTDEKNVLLVSKDEPKTV